MSQNRYRRPKDEAEKLERRFARYSEAFRMVNEGTARPEVVKAVECVREGLTWRQATKKLGIARSTYYQRLNDPTDEENRARKARHHGTCEDCGEPTFNGGALDTPRRCLNCEQTKNLDENEQIIELWEKGWTAPEISAEIGVSASRITDRIDAIRRLGGIPITRHRLRSRSSWRTVERMWQAGATNAEIAIRIGSTPASVTEIVKSMRRAGYDMPKGRPSQRKVAA